jgi:3-phenylpropionate/cinnamic acid dioxygenase small subunit
MKMVQVYDLPAAAPPGLSRDVERFLYYEAELLDAYDLLSWLKLVTADIDYRMPVRTAVDELDLDQSYSNQAYHMIEDYGSLNARMTRLVSGSAWAEKPPSRVRRHISNIRVAPADEDTVKARSYLLFTWARDEQQYTLSGERQDVLRVIEGRLYLARRLVLLDHASIPIPNLSVVL